MSDKEEKFTTGETEQGNPDNVVEQKISQPDLVEYHIFRSGEIKYRFMDTKDEPIEITKDKEGDDIRKSLIENRKRVRYFYYDQYSIQHLLTPTPLKITVGTPHSADARYKDQMGGAQMYLVDFSLMASKEENEKVSYSSPTAKFEMRLNDSRLYPNDVTMAAILGVMLNTGYEDFVYNGFSLKNGKPGGSRTHLNGMCCDFRYLRKDKTGEPLDLSTATDWKLLDVERQNKFVDELIKFGWSLFYCWHYWDAGNSKISAAEWNRETNALKEKAKELQKKGDAAAVIGGLTVLADMTEPAVLKNTEHLIKHHNHIHAGEYSKKITELDKIPEPTAKIVKYGEDRYAVIPLPSTPNSKDLPNAGISQPNLGVLPPEILQGVEGAMK